ncbi:MAG: hypothetical protein OEX81_02270 [Candidatus Pacebacteria bacterium]|nr:hypothetical protein [Candidatus Paceibacterota bacterium]
MKLEISRSICQHADSMRCDRCSTKILNFEAEGACIINQEDDGSSDVTLVVHDGENATTFIFPIEATVPFAQGGLELLLEGLAQYKQE